MARRSKKSAERELGKLPEVGTVPREEKPTLPSLEPLPPVVLQWKKDDDGAYVGIQSDKYAITKSGKKYVLIYNGDEEPLHKGTLGGCQDTANVHYNAALLAKLNEVPLERLPTVSTIGVKAQPLVTEPATQEELQKLANDASGGKGCVPVANLNAGDVFVAENGQIGRIIEVVPDGDTKVHWIARLTSAKPLSPEQASRVLAAQQIRGRGRPRNTEESNGNGASTPSTPRAPRQPRQTTGELDRFGMRSNSGAAVINSVLSKEIGQTAAEIHAKVTAAGVVTPLARIHGHMKKLASRSQAKLDGGKWVCLI